MTDEQTSKKAASGRLGGLKSKGRKAPRVYCRRCGKNIAGRKMGDRYAPRRHATIAGPCAGVKMPGVDPANVITHGGVDRRGEICRCAKCGTVEPCTSARDFAGVNGQPLLCFDCQGPHYGNGLPVDPSHVVPGGDDE